MRPIRSQLQPSMPSSDKVKAMFRRRGLQCSDIVTAAHPLPLSDYRQPLARIEVLASQCEGARSAVHYQILTLYERFTFILPDRHFEENTFVLRNGTFEEARMMLASGVRVGRLSNIVPTREVDATS